MFESRTGDPMSGCLAANLSCDTPLRFRPRVLSAIAEEERARRLMDERAIVQRCLAGETEAYEALVRAYQSRAISLAWNIVGNGEDARDVAQDALIQAYRNLDRFDQSRDFKSWLLGIVVKRSLDLIRRRRSFLAFFKQQVRDRRGQIAALTTSPSDTIEDSALFPHLLACCGEKERVAMVLRVNEDYSARDIAAVLGCTESTARAHLFNARRKLKRELLKLNIRADSDVAQGDEP